MIYFSKADSLCSLTLLFSTASSNMEDFVKEPVGDFVNVAIRTRSQFPKLREKEENVING